MDEAQKLLEKSKIDKEIIAWYEHDAVYVYTLVAYALQQGFITEEEAGIAKNNLDAYWNKKIDDTKEKNNKQSKYMISVFRKIGFTPTKLLWRLTEQFPKYIIGKPENCEFVAHDEPIIKALELNSIDYYKIINELAEQKFISKRIDKKRMIYKINFPLIIKTWEEDPKNKDV